MSPSPALEPEVATADPPEEDLTPEAGEDPTAIYRQKFGDRYERLPKQIVNYLLELTNEFGRQDRYLRRNEVNRDRKLRFYEKGVQHIFETNSGGWVQGTSGALITCTNGSMQMGEFCDDYDIFGPYSRIQQSVLTQTMPGVSFRPAGDDATRSEATDSAKMAEGYWEVFQRNNDMRKIATQIVRMFQLSGRAVTWARTEANAERFGHNADGTPKRVEVASVYGTLEHKCPILAKALGECLYNIIYRDPDVRLAKSWYPGENREGKKFSDLISANEKGIGEDAYERMARIGVLQGARNVTAIGESLDHIATDAQVWLRPAAFTKDTGDALEEPFDEQAKTLGDALKLLYPDGAQVAFVGETYCGSWNCSTDDALDIQLPYEGDGMFGRAILDPAVIPQDNVNDNMNAFRECANYGWPSTWVNAEQEAYTAITKQISAPYTFRQMELKGGEKVADHVFRENELAIPQSLWEATLFLQGEFMQFLLACPPSLWGGSQADVETSSGQHLAASQAMGQMGLFFGRMQRAFSRIAYQAALLASKNPDHSKVIVIPGANGPTSVHLERISKSNFMCYPDEDSQFPESTPQKRAALDGVLEEANLNPTVGAALLNEPRNWKVILEKKGFPELVIPQAEVADYCQFKIEQLVQQSPVRSQGAIEQAMVQHAAATLDPDSTEQPPPFDPMQIPADQPSIMPGPLDYHQWERDYCQSWLSSKARRDEEAKGNLEGIQNVTLYAMAQNAMIPPPPAIPVSVGKPATSPKPGLPQPAAAPAAPVQPAL